MNPIDMIFFEEVGLLKVTALRADRNRLNFRALFLVGTPVERRLCKTFCGTNDRFAREIVEIMEKPEISRLETIRVPFCSTSQE